MRAISWVILANLVACGAKAPPQSVEEASAAEEIAAAVAAVKEQQAAEKQAQEEQLAADAAAAEQIEQASQVSNVDLKITVTHNDGSAHAGRVVRLARSTDWYGEEDWSHAAGDIKLQLEGSGGEIAADWAEIKSITVKIAKVSESTDCTYDSNFSPWMYDCTLRNQASAVTRDGRSWEVTSRHKWRFTYDDDSSEEFWLYKHPARMQDTRTVNLSDASGENYDLYIELQDRLREEVKTMVTGITVTP